MRTPSHWDKDHPAVIAWQKQQHQRTLPFHIRYRGFHITIGLVSLILAGGFVEQQPDLALGFGLFALIWTTPLIADLLNGKQWD